METPLRIQTEGNQVANPATSSSASPGHEKSSVPVQLIPFSDVKDVRPALFEVIERRLREGDVAGIGRLSSKNSEGDINYINIKCKVVSRVHAQLVARGGIVYIKDIGSSSGTFLNGKRLSPALKESPETQLTDGDIIYFGAEYKDKNDCLFIKIMNSNYSTCRL